MKYILLFSAFLICFSAQAQNPGTNAKGKITGKIKDAATKGPVEYATIAVYKQGTTKPLNGTTSDTKGNFSIGNLAPGEYQVSVEFLGYQRFDAQHLVISATQNTVLLNNITLSPAQRMLKGVDVTAQASTIENKIDKLVYNTGNDLTSQGGVATDVLKKVPMVSVDIDGNVELLGSTSIKFLINGKPSSIFGASLSDALQSIPASQIKSIEVITSPGAKYDATGTGGIINIILKDNKVQGYNGSLNLSAGTKFNNGSLNLNARKSNFGVNAYINGNILLRSKSLNTRNRSTFKGDTTQNQFQNGYGYSERNGFQTGVNVDWSITKTDNITAGTSYHHFTNHNDGSTKQEDQLLRLNSLYSDILSNRTSTSQFGENAIDVNFGYKKTFAKEDEELNILYTGSFNKNNSNYDQEIIDNNTAANSSGSLGYTLGTDHSHEISIDYAYPIAKDIILETGAKTEIENISSAINVSTLTDPINRVFTFRPKQSTNFNYGRNVYAYYLSGSFPLLDFFDVKAGLRYEYTSTSIDFAGANIPSYGFLSPSVVFSHKITKAQTIKLSYSKRIERPDFGDLNPFINYSDPYNPSTGNPNLHPEIGNNFELGYNRSFEKGGNLNITTFYRHNGFDVKPFTTHYNTFQEPDTIYNNVLLTSRANVGAEVRIGINISASIPITGKLTLRPNLLFGERRIMDNLPGTPQLVSGVESRLNLNATYQFTGNLAVESFVNYNTPQINLQGKNSSFVAYNFAMRQQFWNKKGSIGLTANVPFNQYVNQTSTFNQAAAPATANTTAQPAISQYTLRQLPFRSFGISFSYKFGKLEFKKEDDNGKENPGPPADQ